MVTANRTERMEAVFDAPTDGKGDVESSDLEKWAQQTTKCTGLRKGHCRAGSLRGSENPLPDSGLENKETFKQTPEGTHERSARPRNGGEETGSSSLLRITGDYQNRMAVDIFCSNLGNAPLQRHLLAVDTPAWSRLFVPRMILRKYGCLDTEYATQYGA